MAEFTRVFRVQGMDSQASPRFQMVPIRGKRFVILRDGAGMTLDIDRSICNFTEILESALPVGDRAPRKKGDRFFRLEAGDSPIGTALVATGGGSSLPLLLDIEVKNKLRVLVAFNFLSDNATPVHKTKRPEADVARFMKTAKFVWENQANVEIVKSGGILRPKIEQNLTATILVAVGATVPFRPPGSVAKAIDGKGAPGVNLNVFFVHNLQAAGSTGDLDAATSIDTQKDGIANSGLCLFEDKAGKDQDLSFAHEIGHHLGLVDRALPTRDLMHGTTGQRGLNLTRADVTRVNP